MEYYIWLVVYTVFVVFHTILFIAFIMGLVHVIIRKKSPYWAVFIGGYLLIHSLYGGCPLLEIENFFSIQVNGPIKNIGDIYVEFGQLGLVVRLIFFVAALLLLRTSYVSWHQGVIQVDWSRIYRTKTRLSYNA